MLIQINSNKRLCNHTFKFRNMSKESCRKLVFPNSHSMAKLRVCFRHYKLLLFIVMFCQSASSSTSLSFGFYTFSCPTAEIMVKNTVRTASFEDQTVPGKLIRLIFHDCFVEGCDASVLLQGNGTEKTDPANKFLDGFSVIDSAKRVLEVFCPGTVSCADILALAARDAIEFSGGPSIQIPTGRRDGRSSLAANVRPNIIDTSFTLNEMAKVFSSKGLSLDDLVALSGAHTIGSAHCNSFNERFKLDSDGKLTLLDKSLNGQYAAQLTKMCPAGTRDDSIKVNNDPGTPLQFDNQYYKNLLEQKGLFSSDSALLSDERTKSKVAEFANNQDSFFESWGASFLKLSAIGVKTDNEGEIRQSCSMING